MSEKNRLSRMLAVVIAMLAVVGMAYVVSLFYTRAFAAQPATHNMGMDMSVSMQTTLTPLPNTPTPAAIPGCRIQDLNFNTTGAGAAFKEPDVISAVNGAVTTTLTVKYGDNKIGDCPVHLRSYNGKLVGPTLRARPGDTLKITLVNDLPQDLTPHVMNTIGGMLNDTNLHTHGLHVSPVGNSDNVLLDIAPGQTFEYEIKIPLNQVPGTYWYHAHNHGTTALDVSSGMEGAIIIMGDQIKSAGGSPTPMPNNIDQLPEIKNAAEKVFVFQQIIYDEAGVIEPDINGGGNFPSNPSLTYFGPCNWEPMKREHTINGQLFPNLTLTTGEVQRWRFIDSGIRETIGVELHGPYTGANKNPPIDEVLKLPVVKLNEIAVDGIARDQVDAWNQVELEPGYRSDVMVKITEAGKYFLVDTSVPELTVTRDPNTGKFTTTKAGSFSLTCGQTPEQPNFLATVVVSGKDKNMPLPTTQEIAALPKPLPDLIALNPATTAMNSSGTKAEPISLYSENFVIPLENINTYQKVDFTLAVHPAGFTAPTPASGPTATPVPFGGPIAFMAADHSFDPQNIRHLKLGNTDEWILNTQADSLYYAHPFHIHINPFQTWRLGPGPDGTLQNGVPELVWRDTIMVKQGIPTYIFTHYTDYIGTFVYHCHILDHEDQGMMEVVEVDP